ncbi:MAG TPA: hypothetical protein DHW61_01750 [Lachnoclostridium phytofermentans]|uniref:Sporulation protein YqfD n=1 Tax=Lachnoclostridium phytofermentans TaxID=66219 RepID=A0A3D2X3C8_9FIRM|nr:hypothetical protein [Lachnoclostridium phytofermentans]
MKGMVIYLLKRLIRWLRGYLYIMMAGGSPEHLINLCSGKGIVLWGLSYGVNKNKKQLGEKDVIYCNILLKDYRELRPLVRKAKAVPYIKERHGFPFFLRHVIRRKVYYLGILLFCALVYTMSLYIWDISIEGGYKHTEEQLMEYLQTTGVYSGVKIKSIECPRIEENIRRDFSDIGWVSAEIKGTRLIVRIVETVLPKLNSETKKTSLNTAHLVATKDGIVNYIVVRSGTPKVELGSVVKKGDILISGVVPVVADGETLVENKTVLADGDISLRTYFEYEDSFPLKYTFPVYTNHKKNGYSITLFGKKIFSHMPRNSYTNYDIITEASTLKLVRNFYLPISFMKTTISEYNIEEAIFSETEATTLANKRLLRYLEKLTNQGVTILEQRVDVKVENGTCKSAGKIIVEEPAWDYNPINDSEWRVLETDEHSGDNN